MRVADYLMQVVAERGVADVFFLPGGGAMHLNNALLRSPNLRGVSMLHEQGAAIAAETYARTARNFGVCLVTSGPGATNALTGLCGGWFESTPMLFISGQVKRQDLKGDRSIRQLGTQELDIVTMVQSVTKYAIRLMDPTRARYEVERALFLMRQGRPGPVWIDVPLDVQATEIDPTSQVGFAPEEEGYLLSSGNSADLVRSAGLVADLLNGASRPVLLVGHGVHCARAEDALRALVDLLKVPTLTTWIGADLLEDAHPLYFGRPGTVAGRAANFVIQNADLVIAIGCRLDYSITGYNRQQFAREAQVVVVDIDPGEIEKLGDLPSLKIVADAGAFVDQLARVASADGDQKYAQWTARCAEWRARYPVVLSSFSEETDFVNTYVFADVLCDELTASDMIIPGSSGAAIDTFWLAAKLKKGQQAVATGGLGAMGYGLPAAIGGCIGSGGRRTISVDGDGGFMLNIQELEVVKRLQLPVKFFVLNNNGYASIRASQTGYFGETIGADSNSGLTLPSVQRLADAFGIPSRSIANHESMREAIRETLAVDGPVICEVFVQPDQFIGPRISTRLGRDGTMVSSPLEDLSPFLDRDELRENMLIPLIDD